MIASLSSSESEAPTYIQNYWISWQNLANFGLQPLEIVEPPSHTPPHFRCLYEVAHISRSKKGSLLHFRVGSYLHMYLFFLLVDFAVDVG